MTPAMPRFLSASSSDPGFVRDNNEDRVYCDDVRGIFFVIDGMGGHAAGEQAAEIALERMKSRLERQTDSVEQRIREAITLANNAIYEAAQTKDDWKGMACVLTVAVIENGHATIGHVGDSRLYKIRRGAIEKITHDHSPVGEREDSREITEAEAMKHPRRNEVYRDVGTEEHTPDDDDFIEITRIPFESDAALLLCSDGLSDVVPSAGILKIVEENASDRWAAVRKLIVAANEESKDNVSAILVEGEEFASSLKGRHRKPPRREPVSESPLAEEDTRRLAPTARISWYWKIAYLAVGIVLGALLVQSLQKFTPPKEMPHIPERILVGPLSTISAALAGAKPGDTIVVAPGTYHEAVRLQDGVDLIAQKPHESVIEGSISADGLQRTRVEGFQVHADGIGIAVKDSDIEIARCEITGARMAGVRFSGDSRGVLVGSSIHDNPGVGIAVEGASAPALENNIVVSNGMQQGALRPGLLLHSSVRPSITGNIFLSNGAEAVWLTAADDQIALRNYFSVSGPMGRRKPIRVIPNAEVRP